MSSDRYAYPHVCGSCGRDLTPDEFHAYHSRLGSYVCVMSPQQCMANLRGENVTTHTMMFFGKYPTAADRGGA